jgi:predicted permease
VVLPVLTASFLAVARVCLVCAGGVWLGRIGVMNRDFRKSLGRVILLLLLPCMLISKLSINASLDSLCKWAAIPVVALLYAALGMGIGQALVRLLKPSKDLRRAVVAATAFGNSGYIPFTLVAAVAAAAPQFQSDPQAADRGIAFVSVYLMAFSPCLWGIAFPYLGGEHGERLRWRQLLSPPVLSVLAGITLGLVPPFRALLIEEGAPLRVFLDAANVLGAAAIPCGLLILGANLGDRRQTNTEIRRRDIATVCVGRYVLLPALGIPLVLGLFHLGVIPNDPMCLLVLLIEAGVPPATNLAVMCQIHNRNETAMSKLLVWSYIVEIPTLTLLVAVALFLVGKLCA